MVLAQSYAKMVQRNRFATSVSHKEAYHIVLDISETPFDYIPGDSLGIYPSNGVEEVQQLLKVLVRKNQDSKNLFKLQNTFQHQVLIDKVTQKCLQLLIDTKSISAKLIEDWTKILAQSSTEAFSQFSQQLSLLDALQLCEKINFPIEDLVATLKKIGPKYYSIASSQNLSKNQIHLLVARVCYRQNQRWRDGVTTGFLINEAQLNETKIPVRLLSSHFRLPKENKTDLILIGPGVGLAPFRAFLQEREFQKAEGRVWLFFGNRHRKTDFYFEEELKAFLDKNVLTRLSLAFSRDQPEKRYVQHLLLTHADEIWQWLQAGASIYICGDATRMAKDVQGVLLRILEEKGGNTPTEAINLLKQWQKDRRFQKDVY